MPKRDITNQKFGYLVAIEPTDKRRYKSVVWKCKCLLCGNIKEIPLNQITALRQQSCGCLKGGYKNRKHFGCMECGSDKHYAKGLCRRCYCKMIIRRKQESEAHV